MSLAERNTSFRSSLEKMVREQSGSAQYDRLSYKGRDVRMVTARHCSKAAGDIFENEIAQEIDDPQKWLFLIEGTGESIYEVEKATALAQRYDIPCVDPILSYDQIEVVDGLMTLHGADSNSLSREEVIGSLVLEILRLHNSTNIHVAYSALVDFGPEEELYGNLSLFIEKRGSNINYLEDSIMQSMQGLTEVSNFFSSQVFDYFVREYEDKSEVAMYCGRLHDTIPYIQQDEIPEALRLTDEKIVGMILKRETRILERNQRLGVIS